MLAFLLLLGLPVSALEIAGEPPVALLHRVYRPDPLTASGGERCPSNDVRFRVLGQLPDGIRLSAGGYFSGRPTRAGSFEFLVHAANECTYTTRRFTLRVDGAPILLLTPDSLEFAYTQGKAVPAAQNVLVTSSWLDMEYSITAEGAAWIKLDPLRGRTPTAGSPHRGDPVNVSIDPSKLAPGTYRASVKATAWLTSNEPAIAVTLVVRPTSEP